MLMAGGVAYDANDLKQFSRALRKVSQDTYKQYRRSLKDATVEMVAEAKAKASENSTTIADTIKPFAVGAAIGVQVGSAKVPIGELFEEGNAGGSERDLLRGQAVAAEDGTFGHPVFGRKGTWVKQDMHPSVIPAVLANQARTVELLLEGVNRAFKDVGLELE
jgi:hypothetical protein